MHFTSSFAIGLLSYDLILVYFTQNVTFFLKPNLYVCYETYETKYATKNCLCVYRSLDRKA